MYKATRRRRTAKVFVAVCAAGLVAVTGWVLSPSITAPAGTGVKPQAGQASPAPIVTKADVLADKLPRFGLSAPQVPFSTQELRRLSEAAGQAPTLLQYFTKFGQQFRADAVDASYKRGAFPLISWEPWQGRDAGEDQPQFALSRIAGGEFDDYIRQFAADVKKHEKAVGLRFAHEMNGHWYPWSESRSGNKKGDFVKAWRHIHETFQEVGALNVIWVWSPNIIRPVPSVQLEPLYPGDAYVDWLGLVGYAVDETTAAAVFEPTIAKLRKFTQLPVLITETGAQNGPNKPKWIRDFARWIGSRSDLAGFVWFEFSLEEGGSSDWRFTVNQACIEAFQQSMSQIKLAGPPLAGLASPAPGPSAQASANAVSPVVPSASPSRSGGKRS